jgi:hypothetical protein
MYRERLETMTAPALKIDGRYLRARSADRRGF